MDLNTAQRRHIRDQVIFLGLGLACLVLSFFTFFIQGSIPAKSLHCSLGSDCQLMPCAGCRDQ